VGTASTTTNPETIRQVSDRHSHLSIVYHSRGQARTCRVDDLFKKYVCEVHILPMTPGSHILPDEPRLWGFALTNYLLLGSIARGIAGPHHTEKQSYKPPDMSTLTTKTIQLNECYANSARKLPSKPRRTMPTRI
jgi:hypothetical protein